MTPRKLFVHGLSATVARRYGFIVVSGLESADVALIRLQAPYQTLHPNYLFGMRQHEGDLSFHEGHPGYEALRAARAARVPAIVSVYLDRAAVLTDIRDQASALFADFGASDEALLDVLIGKQSAQGRLPIELPASMDAVRAQKADAPMTARGRSTESSRVGREPARSYLEHKPRRCGPPGRTPSLAQGRNPDQRILGSLSAYISPSELAVRAASSRGRKARRRIREPASKNGCVGHLPV